MNNNISLYMNLRSKQIVRVLAGIGPFRCLFLIGIAAILFAGAWNQKIVYGRIFIARFAVYYFRDYCCKLYFFVGYHADCDSSAVDSSCQVSFYSSALYYTEEICCIEGCSENKYHCMRYCFFCLLWGYCTAISISVKYA